MSLIVGLALIALGLLAGELIFRYAIRDHPRRRR